MIINSLFVIIWQAYVVQNACRVKWQTQDVKTEKSAGKNRGFGSVWFFLKTAVFGSVYRHNTKFYPMYVASKL